MTSSIEQRAPCPRGKRLNALRQSLNEICSVDDGPDQSASLQLDEQLVEIPRITHEISVGEPADRRIFCGEDFHGWGEIAFKACLRAAQQPIANGSRVCQPG
jgi:hypothetical protein